MQINSDIEQQITASIKLIRILLSFFVFTVFVMTLLPQLGIVKLQPSSKQSALLPVFLLLSLFLVINGFILKKVFLKTLKSDEVQEQVNACIKAFHLSHLIAFAIFESISLLGFVNYILSDNPNSALLFGFISITCMAIAWPKGEFLRMQIIAS